MKKEMVGICNVCGLRHIRPAPANVAVCAPNGVHNKPVEVALKPHHIDARFEMKQTA